MSSHSPSHGSSSVQNLWTTAQAWFSTKHPEQSNPLKATTKVAHNTVDGVVGTATQYVADILDPAWNAVKNAGKILAPSSWRQYGIKTIPRGVWGVLTHTGKAAMNVLTGVPRAIDKAYTNIITDNLTDVSSGTVDRAPYLGGKFIGNAVKGINALPASFIRTIGTFLPTKLFDEQIDWMKSWSLSQSKPNRLNMEATGWDHGHGGGHH